MTSKLLFAAVLFFSVEMSGTHFAAAADKPQPVDHSSPQKVAQAFTSSLAMQKWERAFQCLTPDSQHHMVVGMMFGAGFLSATDEARKKDLEAILKKHGLESGKKLKALPPKAALKNVKNPALLFGDLVLFIDENQPVKAGEKRKSILKQMAATKLTNFKVDGDKATADIQQGERTRANAARFVRKDGKWYVDMTPKRRKKKSETKKKP